MHTPIIPQHTLQNAQKILFVSHLALGDYTYMQNCFRAFAKHFPHVTMHLWVDELRRTKDVTQWPHLKKYVLYDWVKEAPFFKKVYDQTFYPEGFQSSIKEAQNEAYDIIVSLSVHRQPYYARLIKKIGPHSFKVAQKKPFRLLDFHKRFAYRKINAYIPTYKISASQRADFDSIDHISSIYAHWFHALFGIMLSEEERFPYVIIPNHWQLAGEAQRTSWGISQEEKIIFINSFSKSPDRTWPLENVFELITALQKQTNNHQTIHFIVNVVPEYRSSAESLYKQYGLKNVVLFSAEDHFFQLPTILQLCHLIISVETATMHLANALHIPLIALMRQVNPEWRPIDRQNSTIIKVAARKDWIKAISVEEVVNIVARFITTLWDDKKCIIE